MIGYVPPDEDYNPEHPTTRTDAMRGQIALLNWSRQNLGFTSTEAGSDWVIPYTDSVNQSGSAGKTNSLPLYFLVYHDAVLVSFGSQRTGGGQKSAAGNSLRRRARNAADTGGHGREKIRLVENTWPR